MQGWGAKHHDKQLLLLPAAVGSLLAGLQKHEWHLLLTGRMQSH
jgi:hypothetical protein